MKIYVVETRFNDEYVQLGFSTSKKVAKQKAKELEKGFQESLEYHQPVWVSKYSTNKDKYCKFD